MTADPWPLFASQPTEPAPVEWEHLPPEPPDDDTEPPEQPPQRHNGLTRGENRPYEQTDDSNARRLVDAHMATLRYVPERKQWLVWDGHRWRWDGAGVVVAYARQTADRITGDGDSWKTWRRKSLMSDRIRAMISLASADQRIIARAATLDRRAEELNTPAGVINLRTGALQPPNPAALHTRSTIVAPDFDTPPAAFLNFLADTFAGQPELGTYVQRILGVALVGAVVEQIFPVFHGPGRNGKGVLLRVCQDVLGIGDEGYAAQAATELIVASRFPGHPTEIARLNGARLVITSEVEEGQRFAEARLKLITGGDTLSARFMGKDFFDFTPTHMLVLQANDQPAVTTGGYALWQRIRLIPFSNIVPPEKRNKHLAAELFEREGPAILAWLIRGAVDYHEHGLGEPAAVTAATKEYERDQDTIARFVTERCVLGEPNRPDLVIKSSVLYADYEKWCAEQGDEKRSHKAFTMTLKAQYGVIAEATRTATFYRGIRVDNLDHAAADPGPAEPETLDREHPWS